MREIYASSSFASFTGSESLSDTLVISRLQSFIPSVATGLCGVVVRVFFSPSKWWKLEKSPTPSKSYHGKSKSLWFPRVVFLNLCSRDINRIASGQQTRRIPTLTLVERVTVCQSCKGCNYFCNSCKWAKSVVIFLKFIISMTWCWQKMILCMCFANGD